MKWCGAILVDIQMPETDALDATHAIWHAFPPEHQP